MLGKEPIASGKKYVYYTRRMAQAHDDDGGKNMGVVKGGVFSENTNTWVKERRIIICVYVGGEGK